MPSEDVFPSQISVGRKYIVAEALLDFYQAESTPDFLSALERAQSRYPRLLAFTRFDFEVEITHSIETGSVKSKVTVVAILLALIHAVEHYGDLRDGIDRIYEDAKRFGIQANQYIMFDAHPHTLSPFTFQTRTGLVGALKRFKDQVQFLSEHADDISPKEMKERLGQLRAETDRMLKAAADTGDLEFLANFLWQTSRQVVRASDYPFDREPGLLLEPFRYPMISPNRRDLYAFLDSLRARSHS